MQNRGGYSPYQLVFGTNVNLPSVIADLAPVLKSFTSSDIVRRNLNALHDLMKKEESSERTKRALRRNVRIYCEENYQNGDKVFYKRFCYIIRKTQFLCRFYEEDTSAWLNNQFILLTMYAIQV